MLFTLYTTILFFSSLLSTAMFIRNVYTVYVHRKAWRLVQQNVINVLPVDWHLSEHLRYQAPQRAVQENLQITYTMGFTGDINLSSRREPSVHFRLLSQ